MRLLLTLLFIGGLQPVFAAGFPSGKSATVYSPIQTVLLTNTKQRVLSQNRQLLYASYLPTADSTDFARLKRKAKLSKWLGIGSLIAIFIPIVNIVALPAALVSIVLAGQVKKEAQDKGLLRDADIGKKTSIATLIIFVVALIVAVVVIVAFLNIWR